MISHWIGAGLTIWHPKSDEDAVVEVVAMFLEEDRRRQSHGCLPKLATAHRLEKDFHFLKGARRLILGSDGLRHAVPEGGTAREAGPRRGRAAG